MLELCQMSGDPKRIINMINSCPPLAPHRAMWLVNAISVNPNFDHNGVHIRKIINAIVNRTVVGHEDGR